MTRPVPGLPDELLEEVFLRLPPDEPECLVRASLASKLWLGILSGPRFRGLYSEFHGAPPMLGFVYDPIYKRYEDADIPPFEHTTKFRARMPDDGSWDWEDSCDCRHGHVLLRTFDMKFLIWNPMTGCRRELDEPKTPADAEYRSLGAAVLCAVNDCDHGACHEGPFRVVLVSLYKIDANYVAYVHVSLPQMGNGSKLSSGLSLEDQWTKPCADLHLAGVLACIDNKPSVFIEDALYFLIVIHDSEVIPILKCDLAANCLSLIYAPPLENDPGGNSETMLMAMEDGSLGFAQLNMFTLHLWSRQMGFNGVLSWTAHRVINLKGLVPIQNPKETRTLVGSVEGTDTVFLSTDLGIYGISLKSLSVKKLWKRETFYRLMPYMCFNYPREKVNPCNATH